MIEVQEKLQNLFKLLDDDSLEIQNILRDQLLQNASEVIFNQHRYRAQLDNFHIARFNYIVNELHFPLVKKALHQLVDSSLEDIDLEKGMLLLSYWRDNTLDTFNISGKLDQISREISIGIPLKGHPLSFLDHLNYFLFQEYNFTGNKLDYYNPDNSYLDKVLQTKKGIPITLSILYMLVASRLGMPVFGVPMPAHFILKFYNDEDEIFFDPYYGGKIYSRQICLSYLENARSENVNEILSGCSNVDIIKRVLRNLKLAYSSYEPDAKRVEEIETLLDVLREHHC